MNNELLFLIPFLLLVPSLVHAETGFNFDRSPTGNPDEFLWTSHYNRIWDGSEWVNYIWSQDNNIVKFDSADLSYEFNKLNCSFSLLEPLTNNIEIENYDKTLKIDGLDVALSSCQIISIEATENNLKLTTTQTATNTELKTIFDLKAVGGEEWTYQINNNEGKLSTFTIIETCKNCLSLSTEGDKSDFGFYTFDSKNDEHNTVKTIDTKDSNFQIIYEKTLTDKEGLVIDPSFSATASFDFYITDSNNNGVCATAGSKSDSSVLLARMYDSGSTNDCETTAIQWDTSSVSDSAIITAGTAAFKFDVNSVASPRNCDYMPMSVNLSSATNQQVLDDTLNGTPYLANDATCTTTGNNKSILLGASAETDITTGLSSDRFVLGIKPTSITQDATDHFIQIQSSDDGTATPKPTLEFTYTNPKPNAPTNLAATPTSSSNINLSWTTPTLCYEGCTEYKIFRETPTGNGFSTLVNSTNSSATTYSNSGLTQNTEYNYKVAAYNINGLGANSTAAAATTWAYADFNLTNPTMSVIGDVIRLNGSIRVNAPTVSNVTSIKFYVNNTLTNTNSTFQNQTAPYIAQYGPFWYQMTTDKVYNFSFAVNVQHTFNTDSNYSLNNNNNREYNPDYFTALDPAQGTINYTFPGNHIIKVNRNQSGATFQIECAYISQSNAFFNNTAGIIWDNQTTTGYYTDEYSGFYYVTCYNDGELFSTLLAQNFTNQLVPGLVIFDQLGGFMGASSVILVIIGILSLATGRNFPIIIIIAVSVTGIMGALQLITFGPPIWAALIIVAGITVFGVRKFY